jgi:hypothetical protein
VTRAHVRDDATIYLICCGNSQGDRRGALWDETVEDYEADLRKDARVDEARLALEAYLATRVRKMEERQRVCWIRDHFEMTHEAVAKALEISPTLARRYADEQDGWREYWTRYKEAVPSQESAFDPLPDQSLAA